ncbi:hypothetical protein [Rhodomicrobium vannielii]|uniref:hypothetical protein n=1 Tax=Rhodomicrobium vannielii TaxID=1069 RepID=UPI0009D6A4E9|nr:hypothetical protein [Rhodomicrobium vannielii]
MIFQSADSGNAERRRFTEVYIAAVRSFSFRAERAVMRRAAKGRFEKHAIRQLHVPGRAPIKLIGFIESNCAANVKAGRHKDIQDAVLVGSRDAAAQNLKIDGGAALAGRVVDGLLEGADAYFINGPERMVGFRECLKGGSRCRQTRAHRSRSHEHATDAEYVPAHFFSPWSLFFF